MTTAGNRKANGSVELAGTPSHLLRRCNQFFGDLFARESGDKDLTRQQYLVLTALELHDDASQTMLVDATGIDRSTLAEMVRRMLDRGTPPPPGTTTGITEHDRRQVRASGR